MSIETSYSTHGNFEVSSPSLHSIQMHNETTMFVLRHVSAISSSVTSQNSKNIFASSEYDAPTTDAMAQSLYTNAFNATYYDVFTTQSEYFNNSNSTLSFEQCEEKLQEFKAESNLVFDRINMVRVLVTWIVFLMSTIGNSFVLTSVTIKRRRRNISHPQLMMMHLTFANLAFTFFILPVDAIWNTTMEWYGGDFLCRAVNVLRQFAMYISSAMIVVMGIDRVTCLKCPRALAGQRQRITRMLAIAWIFSFLNAIPAGAIFSAVEHTPYPRCPESKITQCLDLNVLGRANLEAYYVYTMFISFFGPLICILICYIIIAWEISKMARISKEAQKRCSIKRGSNKSVTRRGLDRARRVSQIVTGLITVTFVLCWGPYYVVGFINWFDKTNHTGPQPPEKRLSYSAQVVMLMSMYLNPMLHPVITVLLMKEVRDNVLTQCRKPSGSRRKPTSNRKPVGAMVNLEKNGNMELIPKNNGNGSNRPPRHWV
ncbi:gonadotropin-releasing hormone receptor-like [Styela clava]